MKAKVIKTGEIVDVYHEPQHGQVTNIYKEPVLINGRMWMEDELVFCSKANEAPEKIYLEKVYPDNGVLPNGLNYNPSPNDIEYTRTDAFIEKAYEWLRNNSHNYADNALGKEYLVNDFKNYMKGE